MAKKGLDISTIQAVLKDVQTNLGWSLCIGAGTSVPALPDWFSLVERLINHNCCSEDKIDIDVCQRGSREVCAGGWRLSYYTKKIKNWCSNGVVEGYNG